MSQDNAITWLDWTMPTRSCIEHTAALAEIRKRFAVFSRDALLQRRYGEVEWLSDTGGRTDGGRRLGKSGQSRCSAWFCNTRIVRPIESDTPHQRCSSTAATSPSSFALPRVGLEAFRLPRAVESGFAGPLRAVLHRRMMQCEKTLANPFKTVKCANSLEQFREARDVVSRPERRLRLEDIVRG